MKTQTEYIFVSNYPSSQTQASQGRILCARSLLKFRGGQVFPLECVTRALDFASEDHESLDEQALEQLVTRARLP